MNIVSQNSFVEKKMGQNVEQRVFDVPKGLSGNVVGYARVSTRGQSLDVQVDALVAAAAVRVFQEYASGATQARTRWKECLEYLQPGNILVVNEVGSAVGGPVGVVIYHNTPDG